MAVCLARHDSSQVVGADSDVAGVGHTSGSVGHGVTEGGVGGSDSSTISEGVASVAVASIAQVVAKTWRVHSCTKEVCGESKEFRGSHSP